MKQERYRNAENLRESHYRGAERRRNTRSHEDFYKHIQRATTIPFRPVVRGRPTKKVTRILNLMRDVYSARLNRVEGQYDRRLAEAYRDLTALDRLDVYYATLQVADQDRLAREYHSA